MALLRPAMSEPFADVYLSYLKKGTEVNDITLFAGFDAYVMRVTSDTGDKLLGTLIFIPEVAPNDAVEGL